MNGLWKSILTGVTGRECMEQLIETHNQLKALDGMDLDADNGRLMGVHM